MTSSNDLVQTAILLTRAQLTALRAVSRETHVSMSAYVRAAVDKILAEHRRKNRGPQEEAP
jgi:hypothetical protein